MRTGFVRFPIKRTCFNWKKKYYISIIKKRNQSKEQYYIRAYNQKNLYDLTPNEQKSRIIVAQDHFNTIKQSVTKRYFWFKTHEYFIKHLQGSKEKWFYEVFEVQQVTCMYFDLDWYFDCGAFMSPEHLVKEILYEYHLFIGQNFPGVEINLRNW